MAGQKKRWKNQDGEIVYNSLTECPSASSIPKGTEVKVIPADGSYTINRTSNGAAWYSQGWSNILADRPAAASFGVGEWTIGGEHKSYSNGTAWSDQPLSGSVMQSGEWYTIPSLFRLEMSGTGTITMDSKDSQGVITSAVFTETVSSATNDIGFPYPGDSAVSIRATYTGTATARII